MHPEVRSFPLDGSSFRTRIDVASLREAPKCSHSVEELFGESGGYRGELIALGEFAKKSALSDIVLTYNDIDGRDWPELPDGALG